MSGGAGMRLTKKLFTLFLIVLFFSQYARGEWLNTTSWTVIYNSGTNYSVSQVGSELVFQVSASEAIWAYDIKKVTKFSLSMSVTYEGTSYKGAAYGFFVTLTNGTTIAVSWEGGYTSSFGLHGIADITHELKWSDFSWNVNTVETENVDVLKVLNDLGYSVTLTDISDVKILIQTYYYIGASSPNTVYLHLRSVTLFDTVKLSVIDPSGKPLSGVTVESEGTTIGTTDANGIVTVNLTTIMPTVLLQLSGYKSVNVTLPEFPLNSYLVVMYPSSLQVNLSDYSYWPWRRRILITNKNSYDLKDFQVKITLNSSTFNFSTTTDGSSIRFSWVNQSSGEEVHIPYYIEEWDSFREQATIWIKVPEIPANGTTTVYMYYGNSLAQSESDPNEVFDFYDDFESWSGWIQYGTGVVSQDSTYIKHGKYSLLKDTNGDPNGGYKEIGTTLGRNIILEAWIMRTSNSGSNADRIGVIDDNGNGYGLYKEDYGDTLGVDKRTNYAGTTSPTVTATTTNNNWYWCQLIITDTQVIAQLTDDSGTLKQAILSDTSYNTFTRVYVFGGYPYYVDYLRIRKYADQDPTTVVGSEENVYFESQPPGTKLYIAVTFKDDLGNTLNSVNLKVDGSDYGTLNSGDVITLYNGTHTFTASKEHYLTTTETLDLQTNTTITLTLNRDNYTVIFYAYDYNNTELNDFQVYANGTLLGTFDSGDNTSIKYGTYIFKFSKNGYRSVILTKTIDRDGLIVNFINIYLGTMHRITFNFYDASNNSILNNVTVLINSEENTLNSGDQLWLSEGNYTLTFSKENYENKTLSLELTSDLTMSIYLKPISQNATMTTKPTEPSTMQIDENFNDFGLWGAKAGAKFMAGQWSEAFYDFWTLNPMFSLMLPLIFSLGLIIVSYLVSKNALVPIGVTAIMVTFFSLIGVPLHLSLLSPLAGLFIFFIVWVLWDFYKRFEKS